MDMLWTACVTLTVCCWLAAAERHSVYWNGSNPKFQWDEYIVNVRINDYLDIICPHYQRGEVPSQEAERYVLYMVEKEDYQSCRPQSLDKLRWECTHPFAAHAPEKFSEKFQRFTPFSLGKEFRQGESYYYISKPLHHHGQECMKLRVDVVGPNGGSQEPKVGGKGTGSASTGLGAGGVHNPSNRLPADDPAVIEPEVQKSIGANSEATTVPFSLIVTTVSLLISSLWLH